MVNEKSLNEQIDEFNLDYRRSWKYRKSQKYFKDAKMYGKEVNPESLSRGTQDKKFQKNKKSKS